MQRVAVGIAAGFGEFVADVDQAMAVRVSGLSWSADAHGVDQLVGFLAAFGA